MGRSQREKGKRQEYILRDFLRTLGWKADRVPSSGASQGFKGDVQASKDGKKVLFELKSRKNEYRSIYDLYTHVKSLGADGVAFPSAKDRPLVVILGYGPSVLEGGLSVWEEAVVARQPALKRALRKLFNMHKLVKESDILVVKNDHMPLLFIMYTP